MGKQFLTQLMADPSQGASMLQSIMPLMKMAEGQDKK